MNGELWQTCQKCRDGQEQPCCIECHYCEDHCTCETRPQVSDDERQRRAMAREREEELIKDIMEMAGTWANDGLDLTDKEETFNVDEQKLFSSAWPYRRLDKYTNGWRFVKPEGGSWAASTPTSPETDAALTAIMDEIRAIRNDTWQPSPDWLVARSARIAEAQAKREREQAAQEKRRAAARKAAATRAAKRAAKQRQ